MDRASPQHDVATRIVALRGMDAADTYRFRLVSLRTRIEANWPASGRVSVLRNKGISKDARAFIGDLLVALPSPLPLTPGGEPQALVGEGDIDLRATAGRAVDAALALLELGSMDATYQGDVHMLTSYRADALDPIMVECPSVGLLVATIIGTLEAISDQLTPRPPVMSSKRPAPVPQQAPPAGKKGPAI